MAGSKIFNLFSKNNTKDILQQLNKTTANNISDNIKEVIAEEESPFMLTSLLPTTSVDDLLNDDSSVQEEDEDKNRSESKAAEMTDNPMQVYNIAPNKFSYKDAEPLCQAFGGRLATLEEVENAYNKGAEWCNYGWTQGEMAIYPTQPVTWKKLQQTRNNKVCGIPGINGGYFDTKSKFGVNCYGKKPKKRDIDNLSTEQNMTSITEEQKNKFSDLIKDIPILDFNYLLWSKDANATNVNNKCSS